MKSNNLVSVSTYAKMCGITTMGVYKREQSGLIKFTEIDGKKFVDIAKFPPVTPKSRSHEN